MKTLFAIRFSLFARTTYSCVILSGVRRSRTESKDPYTRVDDCVAPEGLNINNARPPRASALG